MSPGILSPHRCLRPGCGIGRPPITAGSSLATELGRHVPISAAIDVHAGDPTFGYRFIAGRARRGPVHCVGAARMADVFGG